MITLEKQSVDGARTSLWRSRWAAIGAAVAVSLGAGGMFVAQAAPGTESTIVTVAPERILDTRNGNDIGLPGPFVSAVAQKLQVTGAIATATGNKVVVPTGATGVLLNVTPVSPTVAGFISIRPGDAAGAATTSSLNFTAGGISPNSVQVALPTAGANAGKIDITFDAYGVAGPTTDVLIDVVGYTTNANLVALEARVAALEATTAGLHNSVSAYAGGGQQVSLTSADAVVRTVSLMPPANGKVIVTSSGYVWVTDTAGAVIRCSITQGTELDGEAFQYANIPATTSNDASDVIAGTRGYDVLEGVLFSVNLVCDVFTGSNANVSDTWLSAIFAPS